MTENSKWLLGLSAGLGALALGGLYLMSKSETEEKQPNFAEPRDEPKSGEEFAKRKERVSEDSDEDADALRVQGNEYYKSKNYRKAAQLYQKALVILREEEEQLLGAGDAPVANQDDKFSNSSTGSIVHKIATIYNNLSACSERLGQFAEATVLCIKCLELQNGYDKAWARLEKMVLKEQEVKIDMYEYFVVLTALSLFKKLKDQAVMHKADETLTRLCSETAAQEFNYRVVGSFPTVNYLRLYWRTFTGFGDCEFYDMFPLNDQADLTATLTSLESRPMKSVTPKSSDSEENDSEIARVEPLSVDEQLVRATLYFVCAKYKAALIDFENVNKRKDSTKQHRAYCQIQIAAIFSQMSQTEMAMLHFGQAEQICPRNADVYYHRAQLKLGIGRLESALVDFEEALVCDQTHALASSYTSLLEFQRAYHGRDGEDVERVMDDFASKITQHPNCSELYALYAQCETMRENFDQAISLYDKCYEIDGSNANALCHKAMIYLKTGEATKSIQLLAEIVREVDEQNEFVYETLGSIAAQQGDLSSAIDSYAKAISCSRSREEIYQYFARYFTTKARQECKLRFGLEI